MSKWDSGLTEPHRSIAGCDKSPIRVVAGPGTGKTFALMRRIARLVESGVSPERLLLLSFTRIAAQDLKKELLKLNVPGVKRINATTVHGYCFSLLSRQDVIRTTGRVARPLLAFEERFLRTDLADKFGGMRKAKAYLESFKAAWADLQSDTPGWPVDATQRLFQHDLESWLRFHQAMLIGELVFMALSFLRNNPQYSAESQFVEILTDEYQDLNKAEQVLIDLIARHARLTIVGDEDQSIYGFKRAHPEGIREFASSHEKTVNWEIDECRRCPTLVVDVANTLISNNVSREPRALAKRAGNPLGEIIIVQWPTLGRECRELARIIKERIEASAVDPGGVLVLSPVRMFGYRIRNELNALGVPAHSFFSEEALEGNPAEMSNSLGQQAFTLLTILAHPSDIVALRCWCGFGSPSLRKAEWSRLREYCVANDLSPYTALDQVVLGNITIKNVKGIAERYSALKAKISHLSDASLREIIDDLFPSAEPWAEFLRVFCPSKLTPDMTVGSIHATILASIAQPELPTDVDYVRVMSLHKSKGLTAKMVVVTGCLDGLLPAYREDAELSEQQRSLEEQRRLTYVAITRPTQTLILSSSASIPLDMAHKLRISPRTRSSRFIAELGPSAPQTVDGSEL